MNPGIHGLGEVDPAGCSSNDVVLSMVIDIEVDQESDELRAWRLALRPARSRVDVLGGGRSRRGHLPLSDRVVVIGDPALGEQRNEKSR